MLYLLLVFTALMEGAQSAACTGDVIHTEAFDNGCFVFSFEKKKFPDAYGFCRDMGGYLTDLDHSKSQFLESLAKNNTIYAENFWIGLLWTSSLGATVWDSGRRFSYQCHGGSYFSTCAQYKLKDEQCEWTGCSNTYNFICLLDSPNPDPCEEVCSKIQSQRLKATTTLARESFPDGYVTLDQTLPSSEATTNKPTKRVECINSSNTCVCIENQNLNFSANTLTGKTNEADVTLPFVLGLILATSIVINIVMGIVVCWIVVRYKRLHRAKMKPVSFVDSFNIDPNHTPDPCQPNTRANEDTAGQVFLRGQQQTIANNGTTELTYSDIDQVQTQMMASSDYDDVEVSILPGAEVKVKSDDPVKSAPTSQDCSDPHSTYHHLWAQNGQLNMVDTVYGDSSACSVAIEGVSPV